MPYPFDKFEQVLPLSPILFGHPVEDTDLMVVHYEQYPIYEVPEYTKKQHNLSLDIRLADLACQIGLSEFYLCKLFKRSTGVSPHQYLIR